MTASSAPRLRIKKKLESDINEYEIALDHANKANNEALKSIKRYQGQLREAESSYEEAFRVSLTAAPTFPRARWRRPELCWTLPSAARGRPRPSWATLATLSTR